MSRQTAQYISGREVEPKQQKGETSNQNHLLQHAAAQVGGRPVALFSSLKAALEAFSQPVVPFTRHRQPTAHASRLHHRLFPLFAHMPDIVR